MTCFYSYSFSNGRTQIIDEDGNAEDFCEEIKIIQRINDLTANQTSVVVEVTQANGQKLQREFPRSALVREPLAVLADLGLSVANHRDYAISVTEILFDTELSAPTVERHSYLGFRNNASGREFLGRSVLGSNSASTYCEANRLEPKGSFEEWRAGVLHHATTPELQLALVIGASAPIAALLAEKGHLDGAAVYALIGPSSTGKTSSLRLASGLWGKPSTVDGIIDTFIDSDAFFFSQLGRKHGFPHFVDETSALPHRDLTTLIYTISLGRERGICNKDRTPRERHSWSGTVVFTGENSLFLQTNRNQGLFARMVEFSCAWTTSAEAAEGLNRFTSKHYGVAAEPLVRRLLAMPEEELETLFFEATAPLVQEFQPKNGVEHRLIKLYAILLVSAAIASEAWDIPLDLAAIAGIIRSHHMTNEDIRDRYTLVYDHIKRQVTDNWSRFPKEEEAKFATSLWGVRSTHQYRSCVWITAEHFQAFLDAAGEHNTKTTLPQLHQRGYVAKFGDRYKRSHTVGSIDTLCYCLLLQPASAPTPKAKTKPRPNLTHGLSKPELLADTEGPSDGSNGDD